MKHLRSFNENVTQDQLQFFIQKHDLSEREVEILNSFSERSLEAFINGASKGSSYWVTDILKLILALTCYPDYKIYLKENWPGGNGSKNAIARMIDPLIIAGELKIQKLPTNSKTGRKSHRELTWVELEDSATQQQLAESKPKITHNLYDEEDGVYNIKLIGWDAAVKAVKDNNQEVLIEYLKDFKPENGAKNDLIAFAARNGNSDAIKLIASQPDFKLVESAKTIDSIVSAYYTDKLKRGQAVIKELEKIPFTITFQELKDIDKNRSSVSRADDNILLQETAKLAASRLDKTGLHPENYDIQAQEIIDLLKSHKLFILEAYIELGVITREEVDMYKEVIGTKFI